MHSLKRLFGAAWSLCKWALVLGLLAAAVGFWFLYRQLDEEIRRQVEARFRQHYRELRVAVRAAQFVEGEGIQLRDLTILDPRQPGPEGQLLHVQELFVESSARPTDLMGAQLPVKAIHIRRPTIRLTRQADGRWSAAQLLPWPRFTECSPVVSIEDGTLEIVDATKQPSSQLTMYGLQLRLSPEEGTAGCGRLAFAGQINGDHHRRLEFSGVFAPASQELSLQARVEHLALSEELRALLPTEAAAALAALGALRGDVDADVQLERTAEQPLQYDVSGTLTHGSLLDPRFPYPLSDLWATFRVRNDGFTIRDLAARHGQTVVRASGGRSGGLTSGPFWLKAEIRRLLLDTRLFSALPPTAQEQWRKFMPTGEADLDLVVSHDGVRWSRDAQARLNNVSFTYAKFPYPLDRATGRLNYKDDALEVDVTAYAGPHERHPIQIHGRVQRPGPDFDGWFELRGERLPIDERLLAALPESSRQVVRSLEPRGNLRFFARFWRSLDEPGAPLRRQATLEVSGGAIQYQRFPYPLRDVKGLIEVRDREWAFCEFSGSNDTGQVSCQGTLAPAEVGHELRLDFVGLDVPLESELRDALPPRMQRLWNDLRPRGAVNLSFQTHYRSADKRLSLTLDAQPLEDASSIELRAFPYRLEKLRGTVRYRDGRVTLERMRGVHGELSAATNGSWEADADGNWTLRLRDLTVDHARLDQELLTALPAGLRNLATRLELDGLLNLRGAVDLAGLSQPQSPVRAAWDVELDLHQGSLVAGLPLRDIHGGARLSGTFDGQAARCRGELEIDSLSWRQFQITEVRGPLFADAQRVLLGTAAAELAGEASPRAVLARFCGGQLQVDAAVRLAPEPAFASTIRIREPFDLTHLAQESLPGRQNVSGRVSGYVELQGSGSVHSLSGRGQLALREGNLYELPVMVAMLKLLSAKNPDPTAFTSADCGFRVETGHVYFDRMDINGDAISLTGQGWMKPDLEIGLQFAALVGRDEFRVPILREVVGGASKQILQVAVTGTLDDPLVKRDVLPGVNQALQQIQRELNGPPPRPSSGASAVGGSLRR